MSWEELLKMWQLDDIIVTIKEPLRKDEVYKKGRLTGFKSGLFGGGHYNFQRDKDLPNSRSVPMSFSSTRKHWIRKPKVHVTYNIFTWGLAGGKEHSDWIDIDNCTFEFETTSKE